MEKQLASQLLHLLSIASPTFHESVISKHIHETLQSQFPAAIIKTHEDSLIIEFPGDSALPHIVFVGHSDTVPPFFDPYIDNGKIYGSGASDMKAALACYMTLFESAIEKLTEHYRLSCIIYAREEGTTLEQNGLSGLIKAYPEFFTCIDLAIIGEPTNNHIQLGCVGSIHAEIDFIGKACHSARPWDGKNALYEAIPFLQEISKETPKKHTLFGVDFYDVMSVTSTKSDSGRTTIPGKWTCNVNFRFAPVYTLDEAVSYFINKLQEFGASLENIRIIDQVPAGSVIETPLFKQVVAQLNQPVEAKQAWTDVAQLTRLGIPAFNFGPGLTSQAHRPDEYVVLDDMVKHCSLLESLIKRKS